MSYFTQMMVHEGFWPEDLSAKFFEGKEELWEVEWLNQDILDTPSKQSTGNPGRKINDCFHCSDKEFLKPHPRPERMLAFIRRQRKLRRIVVTKDYPELPRVVTGQKVRKVVANEKIIPAKWVDYFGQKQKRLAKEKYGKAYATCHHRTNPNKELRIVQHMNWIDLEQTAVLMIKEREAKIRLSDGGFVRLNSGKDGVLDSAICRISRAS